MHEERSLSYISKVKTSFFFFLFNIKRVASIEQVGKGKEKKNENKKPKKLKKELNLKMKHIYLANIMA